MTNLFLLTSLLFIICLIIYIGIPSAIKIILRKAFLTGIKKNKSVYLTFDDGPNPDSTPRILNLLKKYNVKATFFVTGKNIEIFPGLVSEIIAGGHSVGCHGYSHFHPWKIDPVNSILDFVKFNNSLKNIKSAKDIRKLYRPPYGKFNLPSLLYIIFTKKKTIFWDIDPEDYKNPSPDSISGYVIKRMGLGNVILLHDGRGSKNKTAADVTVKAVELILKASQKNGMQFSRIEFTL
jgi:peptidoglycan/xylan/chitin deacetylase (PgdA/CDA1 family)